MSKKHCHISDEKENISESKICSHKHNHRKNSDKKHNSHHDCGCEHGCGCGHGKEKSRGALIATYCLGAIPIIAAFLPFVPTISRILCALLGYAFFGIGVWREMIESFGKKRIFTEFTLMCAATVGAFAIGEYADAAAVMYLYSLGETLSEGAYSRSRKSISELIEISPEYASVIRDGLIVKVAPDEVGVGESILIVTGERVPLDCVVIEGGGEADTSSVTGESIPVSLYSGISCPSGSILVSGSVKAVVESTYENSVVSRLSRAINEASERKSPREKRMSRLARIITPIAFATALAVSVLGSIVSGNVGQWVYAGLVILVVSCPCSLVLSVPLTYFAGIGAAASRGIIFRGGESVDSTARLCALAFDKTGTLTEPSAKFDGAEIYGDMGESEFLAFCRDALAFSSHAYAISFCKTYGGNGSHKIEDAQNIGGRGLVCRIDGQEALFGNATLMREKGICAEDSQGGAILVAYGGRLIGKLNFSSHIKQRTSEAISKIKSQGVYDMCVISGDGEYAVSRVCNELDIKTYYHSTTPDVKGERFIEFSKNVKKDTKMTVGFCGDGLNDSAVIAMADVGIAMGDGGSALTVESADVVLMDGNISKLYEAIRISKRTSKIATQNIVLSLSIKIAVMLLGVLLSVGGGGLPMEIAIVADVGAAVLAVLNALRASRTHK